MRRDGFKCKNSNAMYTLAAHFMSKRCDAMNSITIDLPEEPMHKYINEKRKQGVNVSHLAIVIAAYVRMVAKFPELNRFVVNKRFYQRNEIAVSMVVLKPGEHGAETMSKIYFNHDDTIIDVNRKIEEYINTNRQSGDTNSLDKLVNSLVSLTGVMTFVIGILKWMDKHGLLPKAIIDASPFHASLLITNLASIRTNHIYHHVYEFGTTSISMALGNSREVPSRNRKTGEINFTKCIPAGIVMDERIATGYYFATAFRYLKKFFENPYLLEEKVDSVVYDPDVKDHEKKMEKLKIKRNKKN